MCLYYFHFFVYLALQQKKKKKMQARVCLLVCVVVSCIPTLWSLLKTHTFLSRLSSFSQFGTLRTLYISSGGMGDRNLKIMDFGKNMCKITPILKIFKHIKFFSIDDEGRVNASFCLSLWRF